MKQLLKQTARTLVIALSLLSTANAATVWDESVDGDLDNTGATSLGALGVGTFDVFGSVVDLDSDFFSWTLTGSSLASVSLIEWSTGGSFIVRVSDSVSTTVFNSEFLVGSVSNLNVDLYDLTGVSKSGTGFSSGTRTGTAQIDYGFRITTVAAVPVPGAVWLFGSGLIGLLGLARRNHGV